MSEPTEAKDEAAPPTTATSTQKPAEATVADDSDPDFDDLDDVLDQFSAATTSNEQSKSQPTPSQSLPSTSGPGRPATDTITSESALPPDLAIPSGPHDGESEEAFMARLTAEMSTVMSKMSLDPAANAATPDDIAKMGRELEEFTRKMEAEGIQPEDMLKAILGEEAGTKVGDMAHEERDRRESESKSKKSKTKSTSPEASRTAAVAAAPDDRPTSSGASKQPAPFNSTVEQIMARMSESSAAATTATATQQGQKPEEELLADMLRALEADSGDGQSDDQLSGMFLSMMQQLTNKDMLYDPMKELSQKFPAWLKDNKPSESNKKLSQAEFERYSQQEKIVQELVAKFEEKGYSDDDPKCRDFIWEKMQEMQAQGAPPEELIANPLPGMGGFGGEGGPEESCPTQ